MDLRAYYRRLREIESGFDDDFVVIKSRPTPDGGIAGRLTEAARDVAAKLIVEGLAVLAEAAEAALFRKQAEDRRNREVERRASANIQFAVVSEHELRKLHPQNSSKE